MKPERNRIWFWILNGIIAVLLIVFIVLNYGTVDLNFWGLKLSGPAFLVILVLFFLGFLTGWLWAYIRYARKEREKNKSQKNNQEDYVKYIEER